MARWIFYASFILSAVLQFIRIDRWGFWFDESYTSALIATDPSQIVHLTGLDVHPPLYYLTLYGWSELFGTSDLALRSMSAVFTLIALIFLLLVLKRLFSDRFAYLATAFAALAPFTIRYGQEARMYAMVAALIMAATWLFVIQMQKDRQQRSIWLWLGYALLISMALYSHYFSVLIVAAHLLCAWVYDTPNPKKTEASSRLKAVWIRFTKIDPKYFVTLCVIILSFVPWIPTLVDQFRTINVGFWIPGVDEVTILNVFTKLTIFDESWTYGWPLLVLAYAVLFLVGWLAYRVLKGMRDTADRRHIYLVAGCFYVPLLLLMIISLMPFVTSFFYFRYFAQFSLFFYASLMLVALFGFKQLPKNLAVLLMGLVIGLNAIGTVRVLAGAEQSANDSNERMAEVLADYQEGDQFIALNQTQWFNTRHYNTTDELTYYLDTGYFYGSHGPIYEADEDILVSSLDEFATQPGDRIWVFTSPGQDPEAPSSWQVAQPTIEGQDSDYYLFVVN